MSAQGRKTASSAFRRSSAAVAAAPIQNCFIPLVVVVLPVIAIFSISLIPNSHSSIRDFISSLPVPFSPSSPPKVIPKSIDHHRLYLDSALNYSSLLDLSMVDAEGPIIRKDINHLLNVGKMIWRRFPTLNDLDLDPNSFRRLHARALPIVHFWSSRRFSRDPRSPEVILSELLGFIRRKKKYSSCAVVGNSGILLEADHGAEIDSHAAVIRLNNAAAGGNNSRHVGRKTTISFVNSNILHDCAQRPKCFCHPYSAGVPVVFYICQPLHLLYYVSCNEAAAADGLAPFLITDPGFDRICSRIAKYYSLKRWFAAGASLEGWSEAHQGSYFHYSSGMQAVVMAVGVCERVSLFGFGQAAKHHYHTSQKEELKLHDYKAEYEFYRDLTVSPELIPFLSSSPEDGGVKFKFPPVVIRH